MLKKYVPGFAKKNLKKLVLNVDKSSVCATEIPLSFFFSRLCGFFIVHSAWNPVKNRPIHNVSFFLKFLFSFVLNFGKNKPQFWPTKFDTGFKTQNGEKIEADLLPKYQSYRIQYKAGQKFHQNLHCARYNLVPSTTLHTHECQKHPLDLKGLFCILSLLLNAP